MVSCKSVYEPREDSNMLETWVRKYAFGKVLDIGTGSGIQAIAAAQNKNVTSVLATDIQKGVIEYCKKCIKNKKIKFLQSDLFKKIRGKFDTIENARHFRKLRLCRKLENFSNSPKSQKPMVFDTIIFNPPYLPQELKLKDLTIEGGKKGYEVVERFLNEVNNFLKPDGGILMVFSSLTKKEKVEEFIKNNLLDFKELERAHIFFEDIHVYLLKKNQLLKIFENKGIKNIKYLARGHRGLLFTGFYRNKKIAVKTKNPQSKATNRIENESKWLKKLNKHGIGPKLLFVANDYFVYEFIDGDFILNCIKKSNKSSIKKIIKNLFNQLFILDKLKIEKEEMHHPIKHIIISKNKPRLIDFERVHYSRNPKNITQFCQFLISGHLSSILKSKKISIDAGKMIKLAKIYKNNQNYQNLKKIIDII